VNAELVRLMVVQVAQLLQKSGTDYLIEQYKKGTLNVSIDDHVSSSRLQANSY